MAKKIVKAKSIKKYNVGGATSSEDPKKKIKTAISNVSSSEKELRSRIERFILKTPETRDIYDFIKKNPYDPSVTKYMNSRNALQSNMQSYKKESYKKGGSVGTSKKK